MLVLTFKVLVYGGFTKTEISHEVSVGDGGVVAPRLAGKRRKLRCNKQYKVQYDDASIICIDKEETMIAARMFPLFWVFSLLITPIDAFSNFYTQVISDVDDTLKSSGGLNVAGVALGGIDVQYERGAVYPGVAEFMFQLSSNNVDTPAKVAILTARAEEFKAALELKASSSLARKFAQAGERAGVSGWGIGPVLYGSVAEWVIQDRKGLRKFTNFERLLQQDPTGEVLRYVYVGDTGELDQQAAETMLREYPEIVQAVFLHVVSGELGDVFIPAPKFINGRPVIFFRTYVGAALAAVELGLMPREGLVQVIDAAMQSLVEEPRSSDKWKDLEADMERATKVLN
ncbi:hypothetical protein FisN_28Lh061 [Fistulifera solaris]|uniref:Uncharacterized protein n=1 Tax=Fistulifera solaris TaxID=1519565 RepID=A0A1Z5KSR8_FISSO|nr:hypothetical protein FisN_28Lh061 [Fistulifera solaris]|eukprot:GAX29237.1 hypothetical protein FisN_28Lh061 [Fistulifera solaris]